VIFGGSGMIGRRAVLEAVSRGHKVTAVVRDPAKMTSKHADLTVVTGDVTDPATVAKLAAGADAVISAVSPATVADADPEVTFAPVVAGLVEGLRAAGADAPPLVVVGGAGSLRLPGGERLMDAPFFPDEYKSAALAHADLLDRLRRVPDLAWSYFSPASVIAPDKRTGTFRLGGDDLVFDADGESFISAEDYAVALVDEAESPKHVRERFTIAY
jgi:putative NADH-flavin reductase